MSNAFTVPDVIRVYVIDYKTHLPVPKIAIMVHLFALQRNDFYLIPPVSDVQGIIEITQDWLTRQVDGNLGQLVAGYTSGLDDLYPQIEFMVTSGDDILKSLESLTDQSALPDLQQIDELATAVNDHYLPVTKNLDLNAEREIQVTLEIEPKTE